MDAELMSALNKLNEHVLPQHAYYFSQPQAGLIALCTYNSKRLTKWLTRDAMLVDIEKITLAAILGEIKGMVDTHKAIQTDIYRAFRLGDV